MAKFNLLSKVYDARNKCHVMCEVQFDVDWQKMADRLARKAFDNKSHKSRAVEGALKVKVYPTKM